MDKRNKKVQDLGGKVANKHGLREFQRAAVERIVERLTAQSGSGRFLLADEVGLGKTFVAKGVIDSLEAKKRTKKGDGYTVVYICSNAEIADQNLGKLCDKSDKDPSDAQPGRLTLLSLQTRKIKAKREKGERQVFGFTPRTSLQINNGTGIAKERRLLLYLLSNIWDIQTDRPAWLEFFRCSSDPGDWKTDAKQKQLKDEFEKKNKLSPDFLAKLKAQWKTLEFKLFPGDKPVSVMGSIDKCVQELDADIKKMNRTRIIGALRKDLASVKNRARIIGALRKDLASVKNRVRIIGALRKGLASVSLDYLAPDLILLDEFQRFSEILAKENTDSVAAKLFTGKNSRMLILSATPFKMLTLQHEKENHHEKFYETLEFLQPGPQQKDWLAEIKGNLEDYKKLLLGEKWVEGDDTELIGLRNKIENALKEVMCRTERNLYLEDSANGIVDIVAEEPLPKIDDVVEYLTLQDFLSNRNIADWNILDYWKSSPSPLSFMVTGYGLIKKIKGDQIKLPPMVLRKRRELPKCAARNAKFRLFFEKLFGKNEERKAPGTWKYLWVRPTCCYYEDKFFIEKSVDLPVEDSGKYCGFEPTKFLVFSHWRFVPKAVSVLASIEAKRLICGSKNLPKAAPLQFKGKNPTHVFDVCFPSPALAACIDPLSILSSKDGLPKESRMRAEARKIIIKQLNNLNIKLGRTNSAPLWKIVALMDANIDKTQIVKKDGFQDALYSFSGARKEQSVQYMRKQGRQYANWMDEEIAASGLSITKKRLDRLVDIALFSPGVSVLRSFLRTFTRIDLDAYNVEAKESGNKPWPHLLLKFCFGPLRQYFNKPFAQAIINRNGSGKTYADRVLSYCRQAHFQATMDEYAHLVYDVLGQKSPDKFIAHVGRAMGMWTGSSAVNSRDAQNHIIQKRESTHFALAFGDNASGESQTKAGTGDVTKKARKSEIREAFNSPFWPFVLATTSVGQEGLDFHLYCRDIVHWNLPSNPVDLEQREGRINRFKGLSIRRNARESAEQVVLQKRDKKTDLWQSVFELVEKEHGAGRFRHGLSPCWIYRSNNGNAEKEIEEAFINRHLLFFAKNSHDQSQYDQLKKLLSIYRLAFGQPRQKDMLDRIMDRHKEMTELELKRKLEKYMIDLSPFKPEQAITRAEKMAERFLDEAREIDKLEKEYDSYKNIIPAESFKIIESQVNDLFRRARDQTLKRDIRLSAITAILYLLDPFDEEHDRHGNIGFADDIKVIQEAYLKVCARTK